MGQKPGRSPVFCVMSKTFVTPKATDAQQASCLERRNPKASPARGF
jgi:hypothetical protein